jgi:outer membrane protein
MLDVRQAYLNLQAAEASNSTAELVSKQARENLDLANGRYKVGAVNPAQASIEKAMGVRY